MELSNCCDAPRWMDLESDICSDCKEHADFYDEGDESLEDGQNQSGANKTD